MSETSGKGNGNGLIQCADCAHFSYFQNAKGHNSPHALGQCNGEAWDGNKGQWAKFSHSCKHFEEKSGEVEAGK